jgi:hypothetical protein
MSNVPDGAQVSDDGQWWWDEGAAAWQPVGSSGGDDSGQGYESGDSGGYDSGGGDVDEYGGLSENYTEDAGQWGQGGGGEGGADGGGGAAFDFDANGVRVGKQDGYGEEYDDDVLNADFSVTNTGTAAGIAYVEVSHGSEVVGTWESDTVAPGASTPGRIDGLGPYSAGEHEFFATVTPAGSIRPKVGPTVVKIDAR